MNIQEIVNALLKQGYTQSRLADEVRTTQATVNRISHGSMPSYVLGKRIEDVYHKNRLR
jgi:ribosome-binding protein aMBF1 (putative translation factor)